MSQQSPFYFPPQLELQVEQALVKLRQGGVVAYPTDTLYGLGGSALDQTSVERVFEIKGRPFGMPLPLLLSGVELLSSVAAEVPPLAEVLAEKFWPGGLTLLVARSEKVPELVVGRGWKVGVRVPDHPIPRELSRRLNAPIVGTSANRSGGPETRTAEEVYEQLGDAVDLILVGGPQPKGRSSTVLDLTGPVPRIVRVGAVSKQAIEAACGRSIQG